MDHFAELYKQVWLRLNTVLPRCLWVMSINALLYESAAVKNVFLTQENIVLDPLQVLRCDTRVFRLASFFVLKENINVTSLLLERVVLLVYVTSYNSLVSKVT